MSFWCETDSWKLQTFWDFVFFLETSWLDSWPLTFSILLSWRALIWQPCCMKAEIIIEHQVIVQACVSMVKYWVSASKLVVYYIFLSAGNLWSYHHWMLVSKTKTKENTACWFLSIFVSLDGLYRLQQQSRVLQSCFPRNQIGFLGRYFIYIYIFMNDAVLRPRKLLIETVVSILC